MKHRKIVEKHDRVGARAASRARDHIAVRALGAVSDIADQEPTMALCLLGAYVGWARNDRQMAKTSLTMLASAALATRWKAWIKRRVDRTRPEAVAEGQTYRAEKGGNDRGALNSFPSGHTADAFAAACAFAGGYPRYGPVVVAMATGVGAAQVVRGRHYPIDTLAGAAIGTAAAMLIDRIMTIGAAQPDVSDTASRASGESTVEPA